MTARKGGETLFMYLSENELIEAFSHSLDDLSPSSVRMYIFGARRFFLYLAENGITNPTSDTILTYKNELAKSMSDCSVALYLSTLHRFFSWCEHENIFPDIARDIKAPHVETLHKRDSLSAEQIKQIISRIDLNTLEGLRNYSMICLMAATGVRTIEVRHANIGDIHYSDSSDGKCILFVQSKGRNDKKEFVQLTAPVREAINDYLTARGNTPDNAPLFASVSRRNYGGRMTTRSISQICKKAMINAGYNSSRLTAHSLRHSAMTLALMAGIDIRDVSKFARHSQIQGTLIYAHDISRKKKECEKAISNAIFPSREDKKTVHVQFNLPFPS